MGNSANRYQPNSGPQSTMGAAIPRAINTATATDLAYSASQLAAYASASALISSFVMPAGKKTSTSDAQIILLQASNAALITVASATAAGVTLDLFVGQVDYIAGLAAVQAAISANVWS
jgi:hypothetical protein